MTPSMVSFVRRAAGALAAVAMFATMVGCLGLQVTLTLDEGGGGYLDMTIDISESALAMAPRSFPRPLPATVAELREAFGSLSGVVVEESSEVATPADRRVSARIRFDDFAVIATSPFFPGTGSSVRSFLGRNTLRLRIGAQGTEGGADDPAASDCGCPPSGNPAAQSEDPNAELAEQLLAGRKIVYTVVTPTPIRSASHGVISPDRRAVTITFDTADYYYLNEPFVATIRW